MEEMTMSRMIQFSLPLFLILMVSACNEPAEGDSRPSAAGHFTMTLSGPGFDGEKEVSVPADQIGGIIYDSSLMWLYQRKEESDSAISGLVMAVERPNLAPGDYDFDGQDVRITFNLNDKDGRSTSIEAETGKVTLTSYSESEKTAAGSFQGQFRSTNYTDQVYSVKGSFLVKQ
jgi:hypothetical protein